MLSVTDLGGFQKLRHDFEATYNKDYSMLWPISGSSYFGKLLFGA